LNILVNLRGDLLNNIHDSSEIKPVEPRKQAIPISKLRQPSKLRLRPNILVCSLSSLFAFILNKLIFILLILIIVILIIKLYLIIYII